MRFRQPSLVALALAASGLLPGPVSADPPAEPARILAWVESRGAPTGLRSRLESLVDDFTSAVVRATSPAISPAQRRLWILDRSDQSKCLLSTETGVHEPRWGRGGYILFLSERDTTGDGRIDFHDEHVVKVVPDVGGVAREIGRGRSAAWSPDGRRVAILTDQGTLRMVDLEGRETSAGPRDTLVLTDSRLPELASTVWMMQVRTGVVEPIRPDMTRQMQWLDSLGADGETLVFPNDQRTDLFVAPGGFREAAQNITNDEHLDLEPAWSPDQSRIVYVSTNPSGISPCKS